MVGNKSICIPFQLLVLRVSVLSRSAARRHLPFRAGTYRDLANHRADPNLDCIFGISVVELVENRSVAASSVASLTRRLVHFHLRTAAARAIALRGFTTYFQIFGNGNSKIRFRVIHSSSSFGESFYSSLFGWAQFPSHFWTTPNPTPHFPTLGILFWGTIYPFSSPSYIYVCFIW